MKRVIMIISLVGVIVIAGLIMLKSNPDKIKVTTIPNSYNNVSLLDEKDNLEITLYFDYKDSYYVKMSNVSSVTLYDEDIILNVSLEQIKYIGEQTISGTKYYGYCFIVSLDNLSSNGLTMSKGFFKIDYYEVETIDVYIGSLSITKVPFYRDESGITNIKQIKGVVNEVDGFDTLVGIYMEIKCEKNIEVNGFKLLDSNNHFSNSEIIEVDDVNSTDSMEDLLGYDYDYTEFKDTTKVLKLKTGINKILVPIKTKERLLKVGFSFEYELEGNRYMYYNNDFIFFKSYELPSSILSTLKYYYYDFN